MFEESFQIDAADGGSSGIKATAHFNLLAYLFNQLGRNVESLWLAVNQHGNLILGVELVAVGAMTVGPAAGAFAFDK